MLVLSLIYRPESAQYVPDQIPQVTDSVKLWKLFAHEFPEYMKEMAVSLLPIIVFFILFQIIFRRMQRRALVRTAVGMAYTYAGLVLFLTGVNAGFMPAGSYLGQVLADNPYRWVIVPVGMVIGYFIVRAEPAVFVLTHQVEDITSGAISAGAMGLSLSIGVAVSLGLAMIRVLTGISIFWFVIPGYAAALILSFFVPKIFTAIAFDSGGVASGPMTATFLLPFAIGACVSTGGDIVTDAFGVVAMVAMTPLITIQILGLVYQFRSKQAENAGAETKEAVFAPLSDDEIIEL